MAPEPPASSVSSPPATEPSVRETLLAALRALERRRRLLQALRGLAESLCVAGCGWLALGACDARIHLGEGLREALGWLCYLVVAAVVVVRVVLPALRPASLFATARLAERAAGGHDEVIASAVQFATAAPAHVSPWMVTRTMVIAAQHLAALPVTRAVSAAPLYRACAWSGVVAMVLLGVCLVHGGGSFLARAVLPGSRIARPSATTLLVVPGDAQVALGDTVDINVVASGAAEDHACQLTVAWNDAAAETMEMEPAGSGYSRHLEAVTRGFSYQVTCGDAESPTYHVHLSTPPHVERIRMHIVPPGYARLPARDVDSGDATVFAGSRVTIQGELTGDPVSSATLASDAGDHAAVLRPGPPQRLSCQLLATSDLSWRWRLVAANGHVASSSQLWQLQVVPDQPPVVTLDAPGVSAEVVSPEQVVALAIDAHDDLALRQLELQVRCNDEVVHRPLALGADPAGLTESIPLELAQLHLAAGDVLRLQLVATDSGGQSTTSPERRWSVVSPQQADNAALERRLREVLAGLDQAAEVCTAQARSWSALCRAAAGDDPQSRRGELVKIRDQAQACAERLVVISAGLASGEPGDDPSSRLAQSLGAWAQAEGEQSELYAARAMSDRDALPYGMAVSAAALGDLDAFRHELRVLLAASAGGVLQAHLQAALVQWQRLASAPADAWQETPWSSGLFACFYSGPSLSGTVAYQEVGLPELENRLVPVVGPVNFSARFTGEVFLPFTGEWRFEATADDGVRVWVDGTRLLDPAAWISQPATTYRGHLHAVSGWHAITVEYFQAQGPSFLHLACALGSEPLLPLSLERVRCHGLPSAAPTPASIPTSTPTLPQVVDAEAPGERMASAHAWRALLKEVISTPVQLHDLGELAANSVVAEQGRQAGALVAGIDPEPGESLSAASLEQARSLDPVLTTANASLSSAAQAISASHDPTSDLADLREALSRLQLSCSHLQMPITLVDSDTLLGAWQALGASRSWGEQLARELPRARARLCERGEQPGEDAQSCRALSGASRALGNMGRQLAELLPLIDQSQDPHSDHQAVGARLLDLGRQLHEAIALTAYADEAQRSPLCAQALALLGSWSELPAGLAQELPRQRLRTQLVHLLGALPQQPALATLQESLRHGDDVLDPGLIASAAAILQGHSQPPLVRDPQLLGVISAGVGAAAQRFTAVSAQAVSSGGESAARDAAELEAREAALAIQPESWLLTPLSPELALRWQALARDLQRFASDGHQCAELSALAERASLLVKAAEGMSPPGASSAASTALSPSGAASPSALLAGLERLVASLRTAGTDALTRPLTRAALLAQTQVAGHPTLDPRSRQQVVDLRRQLHAAISEEAAARSQFAQIQRRTAAHAQELLHGLQHAHALVGVETQASLGALQLVLQTTPGLARDLAAAAGKAPLLQLSGAAADEGRRLQEGLARPLHQAFLAAQDQRASQVLSELGVQAAALSSDEFEAASMLEHSRQERLARRLRLAEAVAMVLPQLLPETSQAQLAAVQEARESSNASSVGYDAASALWERAAGLAAAANTDPVATSAALAAASASEAQALLAGGSSMHALEALQASASGLGRGVASITAATVAAAAGECERSGEHLDEMAAPLSATAASGARAATILASELGRRSEAALEGVMPLLDAATRRDSGSALAATAGSGAQRAAVDEDALAAGAVARASRSAYAVVSSQPERAQAYAQAAALLDQAASVLAMAAGHAHGGGGGDGDAVALANRQAGPGEPQDQRMPVPADAGELARIRLAQDPHQQARSAGIERFDPEDQGAIRAYLRRLGDQR
jgi:hypothetical protein